MIQCNALPIIVSNQFQFRNSIRRACKESGTCCFCCGRGKSASVRSDDDKKSAGLYTARTDAGGFGGGSSASMVHSDGVPAAVGHSVIVTSGDGKVGSSNHSVVAPSSLPVNPVGPALIPYATSSTASAAMSVPAVRRMATAAAAAQTPRTANNTPTPLGPVIMYSNDVSAAAAAASLTASPRATPTPLMGNPGGLYVKRSTTPSSLKLSALHHHHQQQHPPPPGQSYRDDRVSVSPPSRAQSVVPNQAVAAAVAQKQLHYKHPSSSTGQASRIEL